jgi:predicted O-linked N-acetylglucosamine transferase (SPINDLY family)
LPQTSHAVQTLFQKGLALHQAGQTTEAREKYVQVLELQPQHFDALHLSGVIAIQNGDFEQALALIDKAIAIDPGNSAHAPAYSNRGSALRSLGRNREALASFDKALDLKGSQPDVHFNRGNTLRDLGRHEEAIESYDQVLRLVSGHADAYYRRGLCLNDLGRSQAAAASFSQAIKFKPGSAESHNGLGVALSMLSQHPQAAQHFAKAVEIDASYAAAYNNLGNALLSLNQHEAALASFDKAIELGTGTAAVHNNRAMALTSLRRHQAAVESFDKCLLAKPRFPFARGLRIHSQMYICDWADLGDRKINLIGRIERGETATPPWPLLTLVDSLPLQKKAAEIWAAPRHPAQLRLGPIAKYPKHEKVRIGYYSADFHDHATAHLAAELFESHDRSRFEVVGFSFGPDRADAMRARLTKAFDSFLDVRQHSDQRIAEMSRQLEIDIAVDLKGFTQDSRPGIFAHRAAPVQVNYLGYPGTMGVDYMDYIIADDVVIPEADYAFYGEKVVALPHSYQVNDAQRHISEAIYTRKDFGLPEDGFVFCSFNNVFKIVPEMFDIWMRLLQRVPGSVLWLLQDNPAAAANLRAEAERRGVAAERLVFAPRTVHADHLARHRAADLFLDTLPCNAHTTASDALWAGLPVLTCLGNTLTARVAGSLLTAMNVPELITATAEGYESLAFDLARNPARLAQIRRKLAENRQTAPLFNARLFTRHIEEAFTRMHERNQAGLAPAHVRIAP